MNEEFSFAVVFERTRPLGNCLDDLRNNAGVDKCLERKNPSFSRPSVVCRPTDRIDRDCRTRRCITCPANAYCFADVETRLVVIESMAGCFVGVEKGDRSSRKRNRPISNRPFEAGAEMSRSRTDLLEGL